MKYTNWVPNNAKSKSCATNQHHCSRVFHRSALCRGAHCHTCPHTNIALGQHGTVLDRSLRPCYSWVYIRHLKIVHLMPEIVICPTGSELVVCLQQFQILFLWMDISESPKCIIQTTNRVDI